MPRPNVHNSPYMASKASIGYGGIGGKWQEVVSSDVTDGSMKGVCPLLLAYWLLYPILNAHCSTLVSV